MAKINVGILGGFSGKVGPVVGYSWRGQEMIRALPKKSKKKPTDRQLEQQAKFTLAILFLTPMRHFLERYYLRSGQLRSRFNNAVGYTIKNAVTTDGSGNFVLDYAKILISSGQLKAVENGTVTPKAGTKVDFTWDDNSGQGNASTTDRLAVIGYCPELDTYQSFENIASRDEGTVEIPLSAMFGGKEMHFWATFVSESGRLAAVSSYLGVVTNT